RRSTSRSQPSTSRSSSPTRSSRLGTIRKRPFFGRFRRSGVWKVPLDESNSLHEWALERSLVAPYAVWNRDKDGFDRPERRLGPFATAITIRIDFEFLIVTTVHRGTSGAQQARNAIDERAARAR